MGWRPWGTGHPGIPLVEEMRPRHGVPQAALWSLPPVPQPGPHLACTAGGSPTGRMGCWELGHAGMEHSPQLRGAAGGQHSGLGDKERPRAGLGAECVCWRVQAAQSHCVPVLPWGSRVPGGPRPDLHCRALGRTDSSRGVAGCPPTGQPEKFPVHTPRCRQTVTP